MSEWVSVEDGLPSRNMSVIVYAPNGKNQTPNIVREAYFMGSDFWYGYYTARMNGVTHWMPLPKPPTEGDKP